MDGAVVVGHRIGRAKTPDNQAVDRTVVQQIALEVLVIPPESAGAVRSLLDPPLVGQVAVTDDRPIDRQHRRRIDHQGRAETDLQRVVDRRRAGDVDRAGRGRQSDLRVRAGQQIALPVRRRRPVPVAGFAVVWRPLAVGGLCGLLLSARLGSITRVASQLAVTALVVADIALATAPTGSAKRSNAFDVKTPRSAS